jgi:hypothetical protein
MYGVYVKGRHVESKKAIKAAVAENPGSVAVHDTSVFYVGVEGRLTDLPDGTYTFVGPCPYTSRKYYGNLVVKAGKYTVK